MTKSADFIFDVASPNAYLVHKVVPAIEARTGVCFNYIPCLLGGIFQATGNQAPMAAFANIKSKLDYEWLETQRFIAKHSLEDFVMNPHFPINSLLMMRGAIAAELDGKLLPYLDAVLHHMWEAPKKMDDPNVFVAALTGSGFNGSELFARTKVEAIKIKLIENTRSAVERGVFGIPTFFVGDEMFFGKERLGQVEEMLSG